MNDCLLTNALLFPMFKSLLAICKDFVTFIVVSNEIFEFALKLDIHFLCLLVRKCFLEIAYIKEDLSECQL